MRRKDGLAFVDAAEWDFSIVVLRILLASRVKHSGKTEVTYFGSISMPIHIDEYIFWFEISV